MNSRSSFPRLPLGLCFITLASFTHVYAQTPEKQIARPKNCDVTTPLVNNWDFENGLKGWTKSGSAFDSQPADGSDFPTDRASKLVRIGGDYWRGLSYALGQHGCWLILTEDQQMGSLTSSKFDIRAETPYLNLLIGGSEDLANERFELQILSTSEDDAKELERFIRAWAAVDLRRLPDSLRTEDDYVIALVVTGHKGPDQSTLEALQSKTFYLPRFLLGRTARFNIVDNSPSTHISVDFIRFTNEPVSHRGKVWGYADYHTHPNSHLAFGGVRKIHTLWGCPGLDAAVKYEQGKLVADDIPHCRSGHDGGEAAEFFINSVEQRGRKRSHERSGGPEFKDFPSFLSGAHQQMHITQIRRNYEGGLRLMVAIVTHNRGAEFVVSKIDHGTIPPPSTDREVIEASVDEMKKIAKSNEDWMQIALTPKDARRIIGENKMAIILGVEVDQLGELNPEKPESAKTEVKYLWDLGVRAVTPIHGTDNRLGGAAVFRDPYNSVNDFLNRGEYNVRASDLRNYPPRFFQVREGGCWGPLFEQRGECVLFRLKNKQDRVVLRFLLRTQSVPAPMYDNFLGHKNVHGLTAYGRTYIETLMKHGMIIDTAHMSDTSVQDTFDVITSKVKQKRSECSDFSFEAADYSKIPQVCFDDAYPTIISHAHFRAQSFYAEPTLVELARPSEYQISNRNVQMLRYIGGSLGPFVTEKPLSLPPEQDKPHRPPFENDCSGSSKGFGYSFRYAIQTMKGRGVGMATDFTFIPAVAPRFGDKDKACWAFNLAHDEDAERKLNRHLYDRDAQRYGVVYTEPIRPDPRVRYGRNIPLIPSRMDEHWFDFNLEGMAHIGMVPDMLQDLKNLGMTRDDFEVLFSSAESYLQTWEKTWKIAGRLAKRN